MNNLKAHKKHLLPFFPVLLLIASSFQFTACERESTSDFVNIAEVASQHINADLDANYFFSILHKAAYDTALINSDTSIIDSALVSKVIDTITGQTVYTFNYPEGTVSPNFQVKSGTFQAFLDKDFTEEGATFEVLIYEFTINGRTLRGTVYYTYNGNRKYNLESTIVFSGENQALITHHGEKEILWTEGYVTPADSDEQKFSLSGNATSRYVNAYNTEIPLAEIISETDGIWDITFACHKIVKQGKVVINTIISGLTETITGDFQDADLDGCSDKIMLKNPKNFGYPYYF